jgi:hypothetical protein
MQNKKDLEKIIYEMMIESTGTAMCDSGGQDGRHWQHNQKLKLADFRKLPQATCDVGSAYPTINVFHYLVQNCKLDKFCTKFNKINLVAKNDDSDKFYGVSSEAENYLDTLEYKKEGEVWNTYNGECLLSQILQGCYIRIDGELYLIVQLHNGCDARGGYTQARMFLLNEYLIENVYGDIDGISVDTSYDGLKLYDEKRNIVMPKKDSKVNLYI